MGMTWDPELVYKIAEHMGSEFYEKGAHLQMGPGVNVVRVPQNGRAFEYISGEDPHLGSKMAEQVVWGIQNQSVMACVKHFADNSQENNRMSVNENIDERTQFELYFPPFEASVNAGVGSAMCSYNKINGVYACQNKEELMDDLRGYMGFKGFVMSDWGAAHALALDEGLDQEQFSVSIPWYYTHSALKKAPIDSVDTSVKRIFKSFMDLGIFDTFDTRPNDTAFYVNASTPERKAFT